MSLDTVLASGETDGLFSQYGRRFQEKIFQGMLTDVVWAAQSIEVMEPEYFDVKYLAYLTEKYFSYFTKYKTFPTFSLLVSIVKDDFKDGSDGMLKEQIIEYLHRVKSNPDPGDIQYVKDKSLDFCKRQAFKEALEKAVELVSTDDFESVVGLMKDAVAVGMPNTVGHDFFDDLDARFVKTVRQACPTGLDRLDAKDILQGGLGRGEIGIVVANTGVGKSHFLVAMGAGAMRAGKNVVHYTLELTEHAVGLRYDSNLCGIASNEVPDYKEEVKRFYESNELGRLIIKEYPTGGASVMTIRNHLEKLSLKGFRPAVVIIDYADIMRSSKSYDSLRHELKLIYEELRNLASELRIPIWTASQANRESAQSDVVGLENMSESYGKAMVADFVVSISRKSAEKSKGSGRLFVAKNRAGRDGMLFPISIDTACSRFEILDENSLELNEVVAQDANDMKAMLKRKWAESQKINAKREDE
jgi:replicative DNA helicase